MRSALRRPPRGWAALVMDEEWIPDQGKYISHLLSSSGINTVIERLDPDLTRFHETTRELRETALVLLAGDAVDEGLWRELDLQRSRLGHWGATYLLLTPQAAVMLQRFSAHISSWLSGSIWRTDVRDRVESLVYHGRIGEARKVAKANSQSDLGPVAQALALPTTSTLPASGKGDFIDSERWLRDNRPQFAGKWVALRGGTLVDSDKSRKALQARLSSRNDLNEMLVVRVEE